MNETIVTIAGRVITPPAYRQTPNDTEVTRFRVAGNERRFDRRTETWVDGDRLYLGIVCWRRLAFAVHACLDKGDPVVITGRLYTREYEVEGQRRSAVELEAHHIGPDLSRCTATVHRRREAAGSRAEAAGESTVEPGTELAAGPVTEPAAEPGRVLAGAAA
ncbi:MAG TPA: single-stranded DNA-binding protein [Pseudonocardiaceae bacterium]